jgi:hypothetical protein
VKRSFLIAVAGTPIVMAGLAVVSYELRTTGSRALFALYGLSAALLTASAFGLLAFQIYAAIAASPVDGLGEVRRQFYWQILVLAELWVAAVVWPIFDLIEFPTERAADWQTLKAIQIIGGIALAGILYWRFRSFLIHSHPERSVEVKRKFAKWEGLFVRVLYLALILSSTYADARRDYLQGNKITVLLFAAFLILIAVTGIYIRVRIRLRQNAIAEIVSS